MLSPRLMVKSKDRWCMYMTIDGKRVTRDLGRTRAEAEEKLAALHRDGLIDRFFPPTRRAVLFDSDIPRLIARARNGAQGRGMEFNLTADDVRDMLTASGCRCAISGITFDRTYRVPTSGRRPFAVSIDRIDCSRGYTKDNVRLVCAIVNLALGDWGEQTLRRVALGIALKAAGK